MKCKIILKYEFNCSKYERSKHMTINLQRTEAALTEQKKQLDEQLKLQEIRYEKMKNHAMGQLEMLVVLYRNQYYFFFLNIFSLYSRANDKLENLSKVHTIDNAKMKANLKKEEVNRIALQEQLQQKTKENEELVKICDELLQSGSS